MTGPGLGISIIETDNVHQALAVKKSQVNLSVLALSAVITRSTVSGYFRTDFIWIF